MKTLIGFILGTLITYWVHPFAEVDTYRETLVQEIEFRADNYQKCEMVDNRLNGRGKAETKWKCRNGDVFYTTSDFRVYFKEAK